MNDLEALHAALDLDPKDAAARLAIADWYEEQSDNETAAAWRWLAEAGKWPDPQPWKGETVWCWWSKGKQHAVVPWAFAGRLGRPRWKYATRREAEEAAVAAYRQAVAAGWEPEV
jgi:uncharacterized protein (TIGR02996 family)